MGKNITSELQVCMKEFVYNQRRQKRWINNVLICTNSSYALIIMTDEQMQTGTAECSSIKKYNASRDFVRYNSHNFSYSARNQ